MERCILVGVAGSPASSLSPTSTLTPAHHATSRTAPARHSLCTTFSQFLHWYFTISLTTVSAPPAFGYFGPKYRSCFYDLTDLNCRAARPSVGLGRLAPRFPDRSNALSFARLGSIAARRIARAAVGLRRREEGSSVCGSERVRWQKVHENGEISFIQSRLLEEKLPAHPFTHRLAFISRHELIACYCCCC